MVIQCPACQTRFKIADERVGPNGVQVRCSKCTTTFPVRRDDAQSTPSRGYPAATTESTTAPAPPTAPAPGSLDRTALTTPAPAPDPGSLDRTAVTAVPPEFFSPPVGAPGNAPSPFAPPPGQAAAPSPFAPPPPSMPGQTGMETSFAPPPAPGGPFAPPPASPDASLVRPPSRPELGTERMTPPGGSRPAAPPAGFAGLAVGGGAAAPPAPPPGDPFGADPGPGGIPDPFAALADGGAPPGGGGLGAELFGHDDAGAGADDDGAGPTLDSSLREKLLGNTGTLTPGDDDDAGSGEAAPGNGGAAPRLAPPPAMAAPMPRPGAGQERLSLDDESEPIPRGMRPADARAKRKSKPVVNLRQEETAGREARTAYRALLAVFFVGALASAWASLTDGRLTPDHFDRARLSILLGPPKVDAAVAGLAITPDGGRFLDTAPGQPRLFVARGVAVNAGAAPKGFLEVRGRLRDAEGKVLAETKVPCGNSFRDDQLRSLKNADELGRFYVPLGDGGSNAKVSPGAAEPCVVVFYDAPPAEKIAEYDLEIVSAQPAS